MYGISGALLDRSIGVTKMKSDESVRGMDPTANASAVLMTEEYRDIVRECANRDLPIELPNRHIDHASILFNAALQYSSRYMDILTGGLPELFVDKIKAELNAALERGVQVRIIIIKPSAANGGLSNHANLEIYEVPSDIRERVAQGVPHFYVSDDRRYRMEEMHSLDRDFSANPEIRARASFNQPIVGKSLRETFNGLVDVCDSVKTE